MLLQDRPTQKNEQRRKKHSHSTRNIRPSAPVLTDSRRNEIQNPPRPHQEKTGDAEREIRDPLRELGERNIPIERLNSRRFRSVGQRKRKRINMKRFTF